jgi:uridine kinase
VLVEVILLNAKLPFWSDAFDTEKLLCVMEKLRHGQAVDIPNYDFKSYKHNVIQARRVQFS